MKKRSWIRRLWGGRFVILTLGRVSLNISLFSPTIHQAAEKLPAEILKEYRDIFSFFDRCLFTLSFYVTKSKSPVIQAV